MAKKIITDYKLTPEYRLMHAVYKNWKQVVPEAVKRGINLRAYIDFSIKYDAIETTDSETYAQICEYFVRADPKNFQFVESDRFNLNKIQKEKIMSALRAANQK